MAKIVRMRVDPDSELSFASALVNRYCTVQQGIYVLIMYYWLKRL